MNWLIAATEPIRVVVDSGPSAPWYEKAEFWALLIPLLVAVATLWHAQRQALAKREAERRDRLAAEYGRALADAIAWTEMPYRITRRTSDSPEVLASLVQQSHALQERLEHNASWLLLDSEPAGLAYKALVASVKQKAEGDIHAAWERRPITTAVGMNLPPEAMSKVDVSAERAAYITAVRAHLDSLDTPRSRRSAR